MSTLLFKNNDNKQITGKPYFLSKEERMKMKIDKLKAVYGLSHGNGKRKKKRRKK